MLPSISEGTADLLYWGGNVLVIIAGILGILGAFGVVWGDRVRDSLGDQRIAANELKTAEANRDAEQAKRETAELQLKVAVLSPPPWKLTNESRVSIEDRLGQKYIGQKFRVEYGNDDAPGRAMANDLCRVLEGKPLWSGTTLEVEPIDQTQGVSAITDLDEIVAVNSSTGTVKMGPSPQTGPLNDLFIALSAAKLSLDSPTIPGGGVAMRHRGRNDIPSGLIIITVKSPWCSDMNPMSDPINNPQGKPY